MSEAVAATQETEPTTSPWKPRLWIAGVLGVLAPLGMLYVGRLRLALYYLFLGMLAGIAESLRVFSGIPWLGGVSLTTGLIVVCSVHSIYLASTASAGMVRPWYSRWYGLTMFYLAIFLSAFLFRAFAFEPFVYPHASMLPNIRPGSRILVQKWGYGNYGAVGLSILRTDVAEGYRPDRGEVLAIEHPADTSISLVKRVIGLPGDLVERRGKRLIVNGEPLALTKRHVSRSFAYSVFSEKLENMTYDVIYANEPASNDFKLIVPERAYLLLGDNRDFSEDNRLWLVVPVDHLIGKVVATW